MRRNEHTHTRTHRQLLPKYVSSTRCAVGGWVAGCWLGLGGWAWHRSPISAGILPVDLFYALKWSTCVWLCVWLCVCLGPGLVTAGHRQTQSGTETETERDDERDRGRESVCPTRTCTHTYTYIKRRAHSICTVGAKKTRKWFSKK